MDYPRDPADLERAAASGPTSPDDDILLKDGSTLTGEERGRVVGSPAHLDIRDPLHAATVHRALQAAGVSGEPPSAPSTPKAFDGRVLDQAAASVGRWLARTARQDGAEPTVCSLQMAMNDRSADWPSDDPLRPPPVLKDGLSSRDRRLTRAPTWMS